VEDSLIQYQNKGERMDEKTKDIIIALHTLGEQIDDDRIKSWIERVNCDTKAEFFLEGLHQLLPIYQIYTSYGPTRETVSRRERVV
jgi:hypothetical protein